MFFIPEIEEQQRKDREAFQKYLAKLPAVELLVAASFGVRERGVCSPGLCGERFRRYKISRTRYERLLSEGSLS